MCLFFYLISPMPVGASKHVCVRTPVHCDRPTVSRRQANPRMLSVAEGVGLSRKAIWFANGTGAHHATLSGCVRIAKGYGLFNFHFAPDQLFHSRNAFKNDTTSSKESPIESASIRIPPGAAPYFAHWRTKPAHTLPLPSSK